MPRRFLSKQDKEKKQRKEKLVSLLKTTLTDIYKYVSREDELNIFVKCLNMFCLDKTIIEGRISLNDLLSDPSPSAKMIITQFNNLIILFESLVASEEHIDFDQREYAILCTKELCKHIDKSKGEDFGKRKIRNYNFIQALSYETFKIGPGLRLSIPLEVDKNLKIKR